jgi:hypothetical protein
MVLSQANNAIIEACFTEKAGAIGQIVHEFQGKVWNKSSFELKIKTKGLKHWISFKEGTWKWQS